jgi:hypothetical protein
MGHNKGGHLLRLEPDGIELFEALPEIKEKFVQAHWYQFCSAFQGHHTEVSMTFAKNFDGYQTQVGNLIIQVSEHSISQPSIYLSMVKDGSKRKKSQGTSTISFSPRITKTQNGARESQIHGSRRNGRTLYQWFKNT